MAQPGPLVATIGPMVQVELERIEALELLGMVLAHLNNAEAVGDLSPRIPTLMAIRDKLATCLGGDEMTYSKAAVSAVDAAIDKYRSGLDNEIGAALAVVGLSAERADKEAAIRDDMIRVAHRAGASLRQIAEVSGLGRKTVTDIVGADRTRF